MNQYIEQCIQAAIEAGFDILEIYKATDFDVEYKADNSPLTKADKAAHNRIYSFLKETNIPILSEEGEHQHYRERKHWKTFWLIDPLDGTIEFIKKNGEFTVNIALIENQTPILGVVFVPASGIIYYASENGSFKAFVANKTIQENTIEKLPIHQNSEFYRVLGSRSHLSAETEKYIAKLKPVEKKLQLIQMGSSLKICLVAEGAADCYPRLGPTMEWDIAAGHAIAKYAGITIKTIPDNKPLFYNKENLLNPWFLVSKD